MAGLFWNTITNEMRQVLDKFVEHEISRKFYLAGGTALSLQIGHRISIDLDFFSVTEDIPSLKKVLGDSLSSFPATLVDSSWGNLVYLANNVRVGFYGYGYPLVSQTIKNENLTLAGIEDIALMKLDALLARASRKDFYDLYFISKSIPLQEIYKKARQKFPSVRDFEVQTTKRLVYFENAEKETDPKLLHTIEWKTIKSYFVNLAKEIEQSWLK